MKTPFINSNNKTQDAPPKLISYGTELHNFVRNNAPIDFENKVIKMYPFIVASLITWPSFWLYKGMNWRYKRGADRLINYINRTFFQAKCMQIAIIATGIVMATYEPKSSVVLHNLSQDKIINQLMNKIKTDD